MTDKQLIVQLWGALHDAKRLAVDTNPGINLREVFPLHTGNIDKALHEGQKRVSEIQLQSLTDSKPKKVTKWIRTIFEQ